MDITSANAIATLVVTDIYPAGFVLEKFSTDQMFEADTEVIAETKMSTDGYIAAGYTPTLKPITFYLEADSPSKKYIQNMNTITQASKKPLTCQLLLTIKSTGESFVYPNGTLVSVKESSGAKTMQPFEALFHFESKVAKPIL